jgi:hypothetical protein
MTRLALGLRAACALGAVLGFVLLPAAQAAEHIKRFASDITINGDASLLVTEVIEVQAEGANIKRGIYRDIPTTYRDRFDNRVRVALEVLEVQRDGEYENYRIENLRNGIRIRIGHADRFLDAGPHTFSITYRTTRQLGFFENYDELYWNVTGNGWGFPIAEASAFVRLPPGAKAVQKTAYTGRQGEQGENYRAIRNDENWTFVTTGPLSAGEGLTIAIAWPKGFVPEPSFREKAGWFMGDNLSTGMAIAGTLLLLVYYWFAWRRFGKDPERGVIFPRFKPPAGLSPAATRFIRMMSFDKTAYSSALINMAVKGYLTIEEEDSTFRLRKQEQGDFKSLANGEKRVSKKLFGEGDSILLENENHEALGVSVKRLKESLKAEYEKAYFKRNKGLFALGIIFSLMVIYLSGISGADPLAIIRAPMTAGVFGGLAYVVLHFWSDDDDPTFKAIPLGVGLFRQIFFAVFIFIFASSVFGAMAFNILASPVQSICFALIGIINVVFFFLLKKPTLAGRSIMDEIEGFRQYLSVAEEERLNVLNPPEKTPELFERYLPYAMALDVENEWGDKFAAVLAAASVDNNGNGYHPRWYRGSSWRSGNYGNFSTSLGASLGSAVVSSTTAPGSSSGSGGGGFSGGGGGGGGGGGW